MRPAVSAVALSFAAGVSAGVSLPLPPLFCFVSAVGFAIVGARRWSALLVACFFTGAFSGAMAHLQESSDCRRSWQPGNHSAVVRILDAPGRNGVANAQIVFAPEGCAGTVRVRIDPDGMQSGVTLVAVGVPLRWAWF